LEELERVEKSNDNSVIELRNEYKAMCNTASSFVHLKLQLQGILEAFRGMLLGNGEESRVNQDVERKNMLHSVKKWFAGRIKNQKITECDCYTAQLMSLLYNPQQPLEFPQIPTQPIPEESMLKAVSSVFRGRHLSDTIDEEFQKSQREAIMPNTVRGSAEDGDRRFDRVSENEVQDMYLC